MIGIILVLLFIGGIVYLVRISSKKPEEKLDHSHQQQVIELLQNHISFYQKLVNIDTKQQFKKRVINFIDMFVLPMLEKQSIHY